MLLVNVSVSWILERTQELQSDIPLYIVVIFSFNVRLYTVASFIYPTECTTRLFYEIIKTYIKLYIKMLLHVSVFNSHHQGAHCRALLKL